MPLCLTFDLPARGWRHISGLSGLHAQSLARVGIECHIQGNPLLRLNRKALPVQVMAVRQKVMLDVTWHPCAIGTPHPLNSTLKESGTSDAQISRAGGSPACFPVHKDHSSGQGRGAVSSLSDGGG